MEVCDLAVRINHYCDVPTYAGEFMEEEMLNFQIYPPMQVWNDQLKYILWTLVGKALHLRPDARQIDEIFAMMRDYVLKHCRTPEEVGGQLAGIKQMSSRLTDLMSKNYGFYKFMRDHGAASLSYAQFPATLVPRAIALESAFGVNYDNAGVYRKLTPGCVSMRCGAMQDINVDLRRRAATANREFLRAIPKLQQHREQPSTEKLGCVVTLGAGLLVEFRKYGFTLAQIQSLKVIACDMDETLRKELDVVFMHDFGVPFAKSGVDYRFCSIDEVLADPELQGAADVVLMDGVLSYCDDEAHMERYVRGMKSLLKPTGVICCDLQVVTIGLAMCKFVHGWESKMKPEKSPQRAIKKMMRIRKNVGGLKMSYEVDPRNPKPVGVTFQLWLDS